MREKGTDIFSGFRGGFKRGRASDPLNDCADGLSLGEVLGLGF
jgi:hypothetical protein